MNQHRSFTTQVVLEVMTRLKSTAQVCREYDLKEQVVLRWINGCLERVPSLFARPYNRSQDQACIADLEQLVGRLTALWSSRSQKLCSS